MKVSSVMHAGFVSVDEGTSLDDALKLMDEHDVQHLPVLAEGKLVGIVSDRDLLEATGWLPSSVHACRGAEVVDQLPKRVREIMHAPVQTVGPDEDLREASSELLRRRIGCLPVVRDGALVGLLSDRDLVRARADGRIRGAPGDAVVRDLMSADPETVDWHTPLGSAIALCRSLGVRHLPVLQGGRLLGILSDRDLRRALGRGRREEMPIGEIITSDPVTVPPAAPVARAVEILAAQEFSSLPVVEGDECVGILTVTDVLEHCLEALEGGGGAPGEPRSR